MYHQLLGMQAQAAQELQQSSAKQLAELQWELQHAWQQSEQADKAQKAALEAAQDRIAKLEMDCHRSADLAARVEEKATRAETEGMKLMHQLTEIKVSALTTLRQPLGGCMQPCCCSCQGACACLLESTSDNK